MRISGGNAGYTMFRGSVKSTGYPLHLSVSPSLPLPASPCAVTKQLDSTQRRGVFLSTVLRRAMWGEGSALEWEALRLSRGSITPLRGPSGVSCTELGVVKVTQILQRRPAAITINTTHSGKGIITDVESELSPLDKRISGCKVFFYGHRWKSDYLQLTVMAVRLILIPVAVQQCATPCLPVWDMGVRQSL